MDTCIDAEVDADVDMAEEEMDNLLEFERMSHVTVGHMDHAHTSIYYITKSTKHQDNATFTNCMCRSNEYCSCLIRSEVSSNSYINCTLHNKEYHDLQTYMYLFNIQIPYCAIKGDSAALSYYWMK